MAAALAGHSTAQDPVSSHSIGPPGSCAVQIRLTPALKKQLLEAHEGGKPCALRLADASGSGACLSIGDQTVYLTSSTPTGEQERTELVHRAPGAPSGSSTVARVECKLVPQRGGAAAGKGGSLASKARQLEDKLEQHPGGRAPVRPNNPQPSGRTTAPQRTSLMIRKKASPPAEQQLPHVPSAPQQPPQDRNAPAGEPLTQEQVQAAFRESFRMGLSALLSAASLSCQALVQKSADAHQSGHLRYFDPAKKEVVKAPPDKKDVMKELKIIGKFRAPGVYNLLDSARKELEDFLKKKPAKAAAGGGAGGGGKKPPQQQQQQLSPPKPKAPRPRDRDWTSELTNGTTPPPEAPAAKQPSKRKAAGDPEADFTRPTSANKAAKAAKKAKAAASAAAAAAAAAEPPPEQQPKPGEKHRHSNSLESTETRHSSDADPKAAKRSAGKKGHRSGSDAIDGADCSWFREFATRKPKTAPGPILTPQELEESSAEYKLNYKIYHRLHLEIQSAKDRATSLPEAEVRQMWSTRKHQLLQMQAAFQCLHEELSSLKRVARDFVESYTRSR